MTDSRTRPSATLEMVARAAGVSRATVSRVVNGSPKVSPAIAASVAAAIAELNYVPNRAARSLASRTSGAIALIIPEDMTRFFGDPFFATTVQGITERLDTSDYVLNLLVASKDPGHKTAKYLRSGSVDGALVISHHSGDDTLTSTGVPIVFGGRPADESADVYFVDVDNVDGGATATQHLIDLGRTHIATIAGPADMTAGVDRLLGFRQAVAAAGLGASVGGASASGASASGASASGASASGDPAVEYGDFTVSGAIEATRRLLDRAPRIDAIFAASDLMATGVLTVMRERGLTAPDDIAVVGFDDSPVATSAPVPLTTVAQPSHQMGYEMADLLLRVLQGEAGLERRNVMPTRLVRRESA